MDTRTALGRDVLRTVIGWRLKESMLFIPSDDLEDARYLDFACTAAREQFIDRLTDAVTAEQKTGGLVITPDDAEVMFGPLAHHIADAMNEGREGAGRKQRIERAGLIAFVRACAPEAARYCVEPIDGLYKEADALAVFIAETDLRLSDLDETAYRAFMRDTSSPATLRGRIMGYVNRVIDEETLLPQFTTAFRREFSDPAEYRSVADELQLDEPASLAADLVDVRADIENIVDDALGEIWPAR